MNAELSTLCYIERDHHYLMLHRVKKENDINQDKWIGVGGHFEAGESPEECVIREVKEETGLTLTNYAYRGLVTFVSLRGGVTEYMSLFTADGFEGTIKECDEGVLEWVDRDQVWSLDLWEGDKIFFRLLDEQQPFFSLKLVYDQSDNLASATLNGHSLELFDILDENGDKTGLVRERGVAHRDGSLHGTVHIWCLKYENDVPYLLLQKRAALKDSNPGCFDISAAGHISAGDDFDPSALREIAEELGLSVAMTDLIPLGFVRNYSEKVFYGQPFLDNELSKVYLCTAPFDLTDLTLQEEEVESVEWMALDDIIDNVISNTFKHCIHLKELTMIKEYLEKD